jgi:antitoxin component of MazEF toxin-antitoxin module
MHYDVRMRQVLRRIGSSLGVIVPKISLQLWGVGGGDYLELNERGICPIDRSADSHEVLDELKRKIAAEVASRFPANLIRAHSLGNLRRWQRNGVWAPVYDEWLTLLQDTNDGELFAAMLGRNEHSNRLRQSPPYVGLLPREIVRRLNEEATG